MNKLTTILLILCVIGLFTTAFMLGELKSEINKNNAVVANNTTNGTVNTTNETVNTTLVNSTESDIEDTVTDEEETSTDETNSHEMYKSQFNQKDGEPKGETLNEEYIESLPDGLSGQELADYCEEHPPEDYK